MISSKPLSTQLRDEAIVQACFLSWVGRAGKAGSTHWLLQPRHVLSTVKCLFNVLLLAAGPLVHWLLCGGIGRCGSHAGFGPKGFSTSVSTTAAMA